MTKEDTGPKPMGGSGVRTGDAPDMYIPLQRNCYAMEQLISEVETLFPGTSYTVSNRNQRGVAFDVTFVPYADDQLADLLILLDSDERLLDLVADAEGILVSFANNPRTQDDRNSFGLAGAWAVMSGESL